MHFYRYQLDLFLKQCGLFALIVIPIIAKAGERNDSNNELIISQVSAFIIYLVCGVLGDIKFNSIQIINRLFSFTNLLCVIFFIFAFAITIATSQSLNGIIYSVLTYIVFLLSSIYVPYLYKMKISIYSSITIILSFLVFCITYYGIGGGRYVGAISPNHIADIALVAVFLMFFISNNKIFRIVVFLLSLSIIFIVGSRGALVILAFFSLLVFALNHIKIFIRYITPLVVLCFASASVVYYNFIDNIEFLRTFIGLDDPTRGAGSGMSGRDVHWLLGITDILKSPYIGHGFRYGRNENVIVTHMAYLEIMRDVGLIGFMLLMIFLIYAIFKLFLTRSYCIKNSIEHWRLNTIIATIISILANGFIEIHLINIGFPVPLIFILFISYSFYNSKEVADFL